MGVRHGACMSLAAFARVELHVVNHHAPKLQQPALSKLDSSVSTACEVKVQVQYATHRVHSKTLAVHQKQQTATNNIQ